jgi:hypothetical protein
MQYDKQDSDESDSSGHLGAVAGLIIGIILGSLLLNSPSADGSGLPTAPGPIR